MIFLHFNRILLLIFFFLSGFSLLIKSSAKRRYSANQIAARPIPLSQISLGIPERSQYTDANVYEILLVSLLATLGSFLMPSFNTLMTYLVASNRMINRNKPFRKPIFNPSLPVNNVTRPIK